MPPVTQGFPLGSDLALGADVRGASRGEAAALCNELLWQLDGPLHVADEAVAQQLTVELAATRQPFEPARAAVVFRGPDIPAIRDLAAPSLLVEIRHRG